MPGLTIRLYAIFHGNGNGAALPETAPSAIGDHSLIARGY
jgi:hypothetical protein